MGTGAETWVSFRHQELEGIFCVLSRKSGAPVKGPCLEGTEDSLGGSRAQVDVPGRGWKCMQE